MPALHRTVRPTAGIVAIALISLVVSVSAQYLKHRDAKLPRNPDGSPNLTAPAPRLADGTIDLNGLWNAADGRFLTNIAQRAGFTAPFTPAGAAIFKERQDTQGRDRPAGRCLPHTVPDAMLIPGYPWKIVQTLGLTVILFESFTDFRQIFTDGRDFPTERAPTWMGYSVGKWEGDVFVVNTLGFNDKGWLDDGGHPRSEEMKITERFRRRDLGHLQIEFAFEDPRNYMKPWSVTVPFDLLTDTEIIENFCENEKDVPHIFFEGPPKN